MLFLLASSAAIVVALMTQCLAIQAANKQSDRQERQEEARWQRSEAVRKEERDRAEAVRLQARRDEQLRELWGHVLMARWRILGLLGHMNSPNPEQTDAPVAMSPANAAAQAYAVALLGLSALRPLMADFYEITAKLQVALQSDDKSQCGILAGEWSKAFKALEETVCNLQSATQK